MPFTFEPGQVHMLLNVEKRIYPQTTLYSFDNEVKRILKFWMKYPYPDFNTAPIYHTPGVYISGCMDSYFSRWHPTKKMWVSFFCMPAWYKLVLESFNSKLENIKFRIIDERYTNFCVSKILTPKWSSSSQYVEKVVVHTQEVPKTNTVIETMEVAGFSPLIQIEISDKYNMEFSKYYLYLLHHYLRIMNQTELFIPFGWEPDFSQEMWTVPFQINNNIHLAGNPYNGRYRAISENDVEAKRFLHIDDVEDLNCISLAINRWLSMPKQTLLLNFIAHRKIYIQNNIWDSYLRYLKMAELNKEAQNEVSEIDE